LTESSAALRFAAGSQTALMICARAARWFLDSGIQESGGGVARYYIASEGRNALVSTEITGYSVSSFLHLAEVLQEPDLRKAACHAANFLVSAWDEDAQAMPFEWSSDGRDFPERHSYFFDCGIIVRGLLRLWRETGAVMYLERAMQIGESMRRDFMNASDIHPIIMLPGKKPVPRDQRWSRSPGCYQLKSALAWRELLDATGQLRFEQAYDRALGYTMRNHAQFPFLEGDGPRVMDRLHAYCYFLEGLLPALEKPGVEAALREGITLTAQLLRRLRSHFERSDVVAQLLRLRLFSAALDVLPLDQQAAAEEASWIVLHQYQSSDEKLNGAFCFGVREGQRLPFANPVSTAFCAQAISLWQERLDGETDADWRKLI